MTTRWGIKASTWRDVQEVSGEARARALVRMLTTSAVSPPWTRLYRFHEQRQGWSLVETIYAERPTRPSEDVAATVEWGWALPDGGPVPMRDEAEAERFADMHKGSRVFRREVGPWVQVEPPDAARWASGARMAAAYRREAHEIEVQVGRLHYSNDVTEGRRRHAERLRARADRLDGSGS